MDLIKQRGVVPGIKVDLGVKKLGDNGETLTQGLDNLDKRCADYYQRGGNIFLKK